MGWTPNPDRYASMSYRRCGRSGLILPALSFGLWHGFGEDRPLEVKRALCRAAFDLGITHFDLANNYGPPPGSAETAFGEILRTDFQNHRDDLIVSTKAGYFMRPGPYAEWGSRKYLISSCDASLKRLGLDYVDIFYSHRFDPKTPLEETMGALDQIVRSGKALYVGVSSYNAEQTSRAARILEDLGTPFVIHQPSYSMLNRWIEEDRLLDALEAEGLGCIVFSPLAQGMLTNKYLGEAPPAGSRATLGKSLKPEMLSAENLARLRALNDIAQTRGCSLAQLALAWALRDPRVTSALIGASSVAQLRDSVGALALAPLTPEELAQIDRHALEGGINIWAGRGQPAV